MRRLVIAITLLIITLPVRAAENSIVGTWKFVSFVREVVATGERQNEFGDKPEGYISYQPDGGCSLFLSEATAPNGQAAHPQTTKPAH